VSGLDDTIAGLGGGGFAMAMVVAVLLGLRHATDPDHLTAVSTLFLAERETDARRARALGLFWGLGHATTLLALGIPLVLVGAQLPGAAQSAAEVLIGFVIAALAVRLLLRWRRGYFHAHPHRHGSVWHSHPHAHEHAGSAGHPPVHEHGHAESLGRSPRAAFGVGLLHGIGGSGAFAALLVGTASGRAAGVVTLALFALATAVSMAVVSSLFGKVLARGPATRRLATAIPLLGAFGLLFGLGYALGAV
jgi:ABC-type nickel/cobalt efflux system permease component RcnA